MSSAPHAVAPLRVGLLGLGTVGREVARRLIAADRPEPLRALRLVAVGVRDPARDRGVALPEDVVVSGDLHRVAAAPDVDVVVELLGGLDPAGALVEGALDAGRPVVTANKALLAARGADLEARAARSGGALRFEAAVAGGVPALGPLTGELAANRWTSVRGIVNGTTNYILTRMYTDEHSFDDALAEAQREGYAEADPSADIEGHDAAHKLAILVRLAFGRWPDVADIRRAAPAAEGAGEPGVTGVTTDEIQAAEWLDLRLRLVAMARSAGNDAVAASAALCAVPVGSTLGGTDGVTNAVELEGDPVGRVALTGPGAGGPATSSSVLGDLAAIARGEGSTWRYAGSTTPLAIVDGLGGEQRWFFVSRRLARLSDEELPGFRRYLDSPAFVSDPMTLERLRGVLRAAGERAATLYPVLDAGR